MRNLFVFVEGKEDLLFVKKVLHNLFIKHSINIIPIPYQKTRNHEVKPYEVLKELLGHTPLEVFCGMLLGMVIPFIVHYYSFLKVSLQHLG